MKRKGIGKNFLVFGIFLFLIVSVSAANHYVRQGASGNGNDWSNAYGSLPSTLVRGDTYYVADGSYGGYGFNDADSGTTLITIKKATASDHGTSTGWQSSFGDGQVIFTSTISFSSGYYVLDGQTGGGPGSWKSGFGFKVHDRRYLSRSV